jgi:hypothetical protein
MCAVRRVPLMVIVSLARSFDVMVAAACST